MIRVVLPYHLRNLARAEGDVELELAAPVTIRAVIDALMQWKFRAEGEKYIVEQPVEFNLN